MIDNRPRKTDRRVMSPRERLDAYSKRDASGCLIYTRGGSESDYPRIWVNGKKMTTSRAQWTVLHGEPPSDIVVRHKCDVRNCIEPTHLELGTYAENTADMIERGRHGRPAAKITQEDADDIRLYVSAGHTYQQAADRWGITRAYVGHIVRGKYYKNEQ